MPGSGKTHLAYSIPNAFVIDDIQSIESIREAISNNHHHIAITDPNLCESVTRKAAETILSEFSEEIDWIFFENNPEQCRKNVELRNDGRLVEGSIKRFSRTYTIPMGAKVVPVFGVKP